MKSEFGEIFRPQGMRLPNEGNLPQSFFGWGCKLFVPIAQKDARVGLVQI
jgi:hypothetical protein